MKCRQQQQNKVELLLRLLLATQLLELPQKRSSPTAFYKRNRIEADNFIYIFFISDATSATRSRNVANNGPRTGQLL